MHKSASAMVIGLCLLSGGCAHLQEQSLIDSEDPSAWQGMVKVNTEIKRSGDGSFELFGKYPTEIISTQMIPVDMNMTYTLSAWMRTLDSALPASAFMGLRMYDQDRKEIRINNVGVRQDTETVLAAAAAKGAKELLIAKNAKWLVLTEKTTPRPGGIVAFNIQDEYQDLPNFDLSPQVEDLIEEEGQYRVVLQGALKKDYPARTRVRLHSRYGVPFYWAASGWIPAEWKKFSATLSGEARSGTPGYQFWRGTRYVRVFVWFGNYNKIPEEGARLLVDDISFTATPTVQVEVLGNLEWPDRWSVFGPMQGEDHLGDNQLKTIPAEVEVNGKKFAAESVAATDNKLDFRKIYGAFAVNDVAYAFGVISAPRDGKVTLGMGADWWMQVWVDGQLVCDTTDSGNVKWPPSIGDHKRIIHLRQGEHVLAVRFVSGTGSSVLAIGGPDQLRQRQAMSQEGRD